MSAVSHDAHAQAARTTPATIDALFEPYTQPGSPGAAVGVYHQGQQVYAKGYGLADVEAGTPITPQTRFHVASVSKQFAAFAVAMLAREGKVDLDADVRTYLPYVPDFGQTITVRHLILHTSGLRDQWSLFGLGGQDTDGRLRQRQVVNMVARQRALNFAPGSEYAYSNTGYTLLAEIVHAASGQTLREFTTARVFRPLGMNATFFFDNLEEIVPGRANSYERDGEDKPWKRSPLNYDNVGATSLFTTVEDMAKWAGNFTDPKVGDRALIEQVTTNGTLDDGTPIEYGFALIRTQLDGRNVITHSGSDAGFRAIFYYYPDHDFAVMITANTPYKMDLSDKVKAIANLYLPAAKAAVATQLPAVRNDPALAAQIAGTYLPQYDRALTLLVKDGALHQAGRDGATTPLVLRADGSFDDGKRDNFYRPVRAKDGKVVALERHASKPYPPPLRLERAPGAAAADLSRYAGDYRSAELDITYTLAVDGGELVVDSIWSAQPTRLRPVAPDRFESQGWALGSVVFEPGKAKPGHFLVHSGRVRHIRFDRVAQESTP